MTVWDTQFTNGPTGNGSYPIKPAPPADSNYTVWILSNNRLDGKVTPAAQLVDPAAVAKNVVLYVVPFLVFALLVPWKCSVCVHCYYFDYEHSEHEATITRGRMLQPLLPSNLC